MTIKICLVSFHLTCFFCNEFSIFGFSNTDSGTGSSEDGDRPSRMDMMDRAPGNHADWNESRNGSGPNSPDIYDRPMPHPHPLFHPSALHHLRPPHPSGSPPNPNQTATGNTNSNSINKPRIWSLADMASKESKDEPSNLSSNPGNPYHSPGKILSPLAARGLHPLHHPYMRPELYRNFYGSAHMPANPHDAALFESYQRTFGAHNGGMPGISLPSVLSKGPPFGPLSLTTSSPSHNPPTALPPRASPASSTSSTHENHSPEKSMPPATPVNPIAINVTKP
jgi:hypothetical protein